MSPSSFTVSMAKRFKLRICRAIAVTLQSCRSKHPSDLPQDPVRSFSPANSKHPNRRHSPSAGGLSENTKALEEVIAVASFPEKFKWEKEEKWQVVANVCRESTPRRKMYNSSASCGDSEDELMFANRTPQRKTAAEKKKRRAKRNKRNVPFRLRESTSSGDSGWFSCESGRGGDGGGGHKETETLVSSSLTLSTDSSSEFKFHVPLNPIRKTQNSTTNPPQYKRKLCKPTKHRVFNPAVGEDEIPARLSMFMKLTPCIIDGKIKESFAIVKRSENPYEDFKNSMMEMIVEKQMFEHKDLEQLLHCFLSLNSRHYHGIIIQAFYEIWDAFFSAEVQKFSPSSSPASVIPDPGPFN